MIQTQLSPIANEFKLLSNRVNINGVMQSFEDITLNFPPAPIAENLVTNGTFDTDTSGWTQRSGATISVVGGQLQVETTAYQGANQEIPVEIGREYLVEFEVSKDNIDSARMYVGTTSNVLAYRNMNLLAVGRYSATVIPTEPVLVLTAATAAPAGTSLFDNISVIDLGKVERQDLVFLESWHEKIADKDIVYPYGNTQSLLATDSSTSLSTVNGSFIGYGTYSLFGNWQADSALIGKGLVWSTMSDANKKKFVSDPENNVYLAEDGELVQVRYRIRVVEGLGKDWDSIDPQTGDLQYSTTQWITARGQQTAVTDIDLLNSWYKGVNSTLSPYVGDGHFAARDHAVLGRLAAYKSLCFALPLALVSRRNQGAYHPVFNPQGSNEVFRTDAITGRKFYESDAKRPSSTHDCFLLGDSGDTSAYAPNYRGSIASTYSGRPDGKFYDAIYESDVLDLRNSAHKPLDLNRTLEREFNKLVSGTTRGWENGSSITNVISSFTVDIESFASYGGNSQAVRLQDTGNELVPSSIGGTSSSGDIVAYVQGDSGKFYGVYWVFITSGNTLLYLLPSYGDVRADFTLAAQYTVVTVEQNALPFKTNLHCDIVGDPANYYRGHYDFLSSDGVQTFVIGDVIKVVVGFDTWGELGHFYQSKMDGTGNLGTGYDYTNSANFTDLGTDRADSWVTNGIAGNALLVGEEGDDLIPDGTSKTIKLTRKCKEHLLTLFSSDMGVTWNAATLADYAVPFESSENARTAPFGLGNIYMHFYLTEASPFETADNAEVLALGDVWAGNGYLDTYGANAISALLGKVPVGTANKVIESLGQVDKYWLVAGTNVLQADSNYAPEHNPSNLGGSGPSIKLLPHLTRENGKLIMQLLFKEMKYDSDMDVGSEAQIVSDDTSTAYTVGNYYRFYAAEFGTKQHMVLQCVKAVTTTASVLNSYILNVETGSLSSASNGLVYFTTWDGNGWGDDNKFTVLDNESTDTDDNGQVIIEGNKRIKPFLLPYFIGDGE